MEEHREKTTSLLGERPWDKAHLRACCFKDFVRTREELEKLPGGQILAELKSLRLSLKIFLGAVEDLFLSIGKFKTHAVRPQFWHTTNRSIADELEISVQRGILSSTLCAMALVEHCRKFNEEFKIDGYGRETKRYFGDNELHGFIHSLRRYITHVRFTKANWVVNISREGKSVFFLLNRETLSKFNDWNSSAKSYIFKHPDGINVEELFEEYSKEVRKFHSWFLAAVFEKYDQELAEYLNCIRQINGFSSESQWSMLINQVVKQKGLNPYLYLTQYLNDDQIEDVFSHPYRSAEQIDRIIELVDSYQICTEVLRQDIYEAFNVKSK